MHTAAKVGHEYTLKSLVLKGADINIKDNDGVSVLLVIKLVCQCNLEMESMMRAWQNDCAQTGNTAANLAIYKYCFMGRSWTKYYYFEICAH